MIEQVEFSEVRALWERFLWPGRKFPIYEVSPIGMNLQFDPGLIRVKPQFWVFRKEGVAQPLGVISAYATGPGRFRSRGLWVAPEFRGKGIGHLLMIKVISEARKLNCNDIWSVPRVSAWPFYRRMGFRVLKKTEQFEFGPHYLAICPLFTVNSFVEQSVELGRLQAPSSRWS